MTRPIRLTPLFFFKILTLSCCCGLGTGIRCCRRELNLWERIKIVSIFLKLVYPMKSTRFKKKSVWKCLFLSKTSNFVWKCLFLSENVCFCLKMFVFVGKSLFIKSGERIFFYSTENFCFFWKRLFFNISSVFLIMFVFSWFCLIFKEKLRCWIFF